MNNAHLFVIILFLVTAIEVFSQNTVQPSNRRNCSYVSRPIIDLGGGLVIGKAIKIASPRLNDAARRLAQNAIIKVKIEIDESGRVINAVAEGKVPVLLNLTEQAARKTKFSPTYIEGSPIKVKGQIVYRFYLGKPAISYSFEPVKYEPTPIDYKQLGLVKMFDGKLISAIEDLRAGKKLDSYPFIENGQAKIQLCITTKTPEIVERIKQTGFNVLEETQGNGLVGQIAVENLEKLADIEEIRRIFPEL